MCTMQGPDPGDGAAHCGTWSSSSSTMTETIPGRKADLDGPSLRCSSQGILDCGKLTIKCAHSLNKGKGHCPLSAVRRDASGLAEDFSVPLALWTHRSSFSVTLWSPGFSLSCGDCPLISASLASLVTDVPVGGASGSSQEGSPVTGENLPTTECHLTAGSLPPSTPFYRRCSVLDQSSGC